MLDPNMKPLLVTEQARENLAKIVAQVIVSMAKSGEASDRLEKADKADKAS